MKNFAQLNDDDLEKIRTKIENTLRDHEQLFLGFFPNVSFIKTGTVDEILFNVRAEQLIDDEADRNQPPELMVIINSNFDIQISGKAVEGADGYAITHLMKTAIESYLAEEGFINERV